jgi:hypothetical protein
MSNASAEGLKRGIKPQKLISHREFFLTGDTDEFFEE